MIENETNYHTFNRVQVEVRQYMYYLYAGKKRVISRKGNEAQNLQRKKKRVKMVMQGKPKKESKLQENF
jgi:hypothetical protein